jgi:hypothetical protein
LPAIAAAGLLAGCSTTMDEAARLQLNSARIRASQASTRVTRPSDSVRVAGLAVLADGGRSAYVVDLRNANPRPVSDLPISVGYQSADGSTTYLNDGANLTYFESHIPLIRAQGRLTWVFPATRALPRGARPFALVGATSAPATRPTAPLPQITAAGRTRGDHLEVALDNRSGVPQYQLQVYAVAQRSGRDVAAGAVTVEHLGTSSSRTVELPLLGSLSRATVQVEALPTIFH